MMDQEDVMVKDSFILRSWLVQNGGYLHSDVQISHTASEGWHWYAVTSLAVGTSLCTVPHSLTLSYINALVDDQWPVFKANRHKLKIENIGFWYLAVQYANKSKSFWKPYFDCLPKPGDGHTAPLFFDSDEENAWLESTDAGHSATKRRAIYEDYYKSGISVLKDAGIDTTPYTWDLFRWAVTMFTSRSFSSRALRPDESKYWAAYKSGPKGGRQTALMDMSHVPAEDLDFPVLFPVLDIPNHDHQAKVDWSFDPGRFAFSTTQPIEAGSQVYNNYGSKGNDELLLGYGFCIPDNPNDRILLTLKPPSIDLQAQLRRVHPGYFTPSGVWKSDKATFRVFGLVSAEQVAQNIFTQLPGSLLELLVYYIRHERGYEFMFIEKPVDYVTSSEPDSRPRYQPFLARMLVESLMPKLAKLTTNYPSLEPQSDKQRQAKIYRDNQITILQNAITGLKKFTRSLRPQTASSPAMLSGLVILEELLAIWEHTSPITYRDFMSCIRLNSGTDNAEQLVLAGWEEDVWVLAICYIYRSRSEQRGMLANWMAELARDYGDPDTGLQGHMGEKGQEMMGLVDRIGAATTGEQSHWTTGWSAELLELFGGRILGHESILMMVPDDDGRETARIVVYLHGWTQPIDDSDGSRGDIEMA